MCSGHTSVSSVSPPAIATAHMSVPAAILSGIILCAAAGTSSIPPFMYMVDVPAPRISPPIELRKFCSSSISGSRALLVITVSPGTAAAAIIMFSVAPTLG